MRFPPLFRWNFAFSGVFCGVETPKKGVRCVCLAGGKENYPQGLVEEGGDFGDGEGGEEGGVGGVDGRLDEGLFLLLKL